MRNKLLLTMIIVLNLIIFIPKYIAAQDLYYVCATVTGKSDNNWSRREVTYEAPYYKYEKGKYEELTYIKKGTYSISGTAAGKANSNYVIYGNVDSSGKCEDKYVGDGSIQTEFSYEDYEKFKKMSVIDEENKFSIDAYRKAILETNSGSDDEYLEKLKIAYKTLPSKEATIDEIKMYMLSDTKYNDANGISNLTQDVKEEWIKKLKEDASLDKSNKELDDSLRFMLSDDKKLSENAKSDVLQKVDNIIGTNEATYQNKKLYICQSNTIIESSSNAGYQVSNVFFRYLANTPYSDNSYNKTGSYGRNQAPTESATYGLFKKVQQKKIGNVDFSVCSDEYTSERLTYQKYKSMVEKFDVEDNMITQGEYDNYKKQTIIDSQPNNGQQAGGRDLDSYNQCTDDWWTCAWKFLSKGKSSDHKFGTGTDGIDSTLSTLKEMIFDVGNMIFILATAFLGVKYIWGGVDSKFSVKNSLVTLVVAAIVFYGWNAVTDILDIKELLTGSAAGSGVHGVVGKVYNTVMYIINFAAVGGIIYIGIKYMMAGADGKAEMKLKGIPIVMGIIMVYGTVNLINFILKIVEGL